jgi:hypothetical protein
VLEHNRKLLYAAAVAKATTEHNSLPLGDPMAAEDLIPALNDCSRQIKQIEERLRMARSVVY